MNEKEISLLSKNGIMFKIPVDSIKMGIDDEGEEVIDFTLRWTDSSIPPEMTRDDVKIEGKETFIAFLNNSLIERFGENDLVEVSEEE